MPRTYKRKNGARRNKDYTTETLELAVRECADLGRPYAEVAAQYQIPLRTLRNKAKGLHSKSAGGQTVFSQEEEKTMAQHLIKCAEFNMPLDTMDIKMFVQTYLMQRKRTVAKLKNNVPGDDWVSSFLGRHTQLSLRMCQNIKCARAEVKPETIQQYFDNLEKSLKDVPVENILNYDETNLSDDPGVKKCVFRRGVKYPE